MTKCILCQNMTEGSIGAAGLKWASICQPCKDLEDSALVTAVKIQAKVCKLFGALFPEVVAKVQIAEVANGN